MLRFEMDVLAADLLKRTIEGIVVPYGEPGIIAGRAYRFGPGSVRLARARTPLLLDHDRGRPVGVLAELRDEPGGAFASFRIDSTPAGDEALTQAASGSRGAFSIGAELDSPPVAGTDGIVDVEGASIHEVSLLALGAFASAGVTRVAAELEETEGADDDDEEDEELEESSDDDEAGEGAGDDESETEDETMEASNAAPVILATRHPATRELNAGEFVSLSIRAQHGERDAIRLLEAALVESISTDLTGLLPPQYERTVIGAREVDRPLYTAFRGRAIPAVGLQVIKPKWDTHTAGAEAASVDADATSSKVSLSTQSATVVRWDWAGAIPWTVVQRSDPSVIDEIYADAVQGFYLWVEGKIGGELLAASAGVATSIGAAIAEFYVATGNSRTAEVIVMAPDVWGKFADASQLSSSIIQGPASGAGGLSMSLAGLPVVVSGTVTAGSTVLATRRALDARVTEPVRLTANAIGALNVELAVVGEGLFDTDYPAELLKFAAIVPAIAGAMGARSAK